MDALRDLSPDELKQYHVALDTTHTIKGAAKLLKITPARLKAHVKKYPELASYIPGVQPPDDTDTFASPALPAVIEPTREEKLALALKRADEQVREGFDAIGVKGEALEQAIAFRNFGRNHFASMREYITGGVAKLFADLMGDINKDREELDQAGLEVEHIKVLMEDKSNLVRLVLQAYDRVREASLTAAVIESKKKEAKETSQRRKPAFSPLTPTVAMKVEGNVTVNEASK